MAIDAQLLDGLVQLSFAVQAALARVADGYDLSLAQVRLLGILRDREAGVLELAGYLELDKSSVSGLVDRAERRGLVRRAASPDDGRAVRVTLSDHGREVAQKFVKQLERELATLVEPLADADRKRLATLAMRIATLESERAQKRGEPRSAASARSGRAVRGERSERGGRGVERSDSRK